MRIYDGANDLDGYYKKDFFGNLLGWQPRIDLLLGDFTGNTPSPLTISSTGNQMFISYTSNGNGLGKGFSASFTFGKNVTNFSFFSIKKCNKYCSFDR